MSNDQKQTESTQPELIELKPILLFKLISIIGLVFFTLFGVIGLFDQQVQSALTLIFFGLLCLILFIALGSTVRFDIEEITFQSIFGRKTTISWDEIQRVDGHPLTEAIFVYTNAGKRFTVSGQLPKYPTFERYLRHLRRDLFMSDQEQVFKRRLIINFVSVGLIAAGIIFTKASSAGWVIGLPLVFSGLFYLLWIPNTLVLTSDEIIIRSYLKTYRFTPREVDIRLTASKAIADTYYQIHLSPRWYKGKFPLTLLSNNKALLFATIRIWWEERIPFLTIPLRHKEFGPCECCGNTSLTIWGELQEKGEMAAVYYVHWTHKKPDHGASFDLAIGKWGEGTTAEDRYAVSLAFRIIEGVPQFMIIDADTRPIAESALVGTSFKRDQVINSPIQKRVFAMIDEIYLQDNRIAELRA